MFTISIDASTDEKLPLNRPLSSAKPVLKSVNQVARESHLNRSAITLPLIEGFSRFAQIAHDNRPAVLQHSICQALAVLLVNGSQEEKNATDAIDKPLVPLYRNDSRSLKLTIANSTIGPSQELRALDFSLPMKYDELLEKMLSSFSNEVLNQIFNHTAFKSQGAANQPRFFSKRIHIGNFSGRVIKRTPLKVNVDEYKTLSFSKLTHKNNPNLKLYLLGGLDINRPELFRGIACQKNPVKKIFFAIKAMAPGFSEPLEAKHLAASSMNGKCAVETGDDSFSAFFQNVTLDEEGQTTQSDDVDVKFFHHSNIIRHVHGIHLTEQLQPKQGETCVVERFIPQSLQVTANQKHVIFYNAQLNSDFTVLPGSVCDFKLILTDNSEMTANGATIGPEEVIQSGTQASMFTIQNQFQSIQFINPLFNEGGKFQEDSVADVIVNSKGTSNVTYTQVKLSNNLGFKGGTQCQSVHSTFPGGPTTVWLAPKIGDFGEIKPDQPCTIIRTLPNGEIRKWFNALPSRANPCLPEPGTHCHVEIYNPEDDTTTKLSRAEILEEGKALYNSTVY